MEFRVKDGDDPRMKNLANRAGHRPHNALQCTLINIETAERWVGSTIKVLSDIAPISLSTINRLRAGTASKELTGKYKLEI